MSESFTLRAADGDTSRSRGLELSAAGQLSVSGERGRGQALRVLRRDANGLLVALWGERIVHGYVLGANGELALYVDGRLERVTLKSAAVDAMEQEVAGAGGHSGVFELKSPIPGLIKKVAVQAGDEVAAGQTVVVLEAMKMENEIPAPYAGTVKCVDVQPGQAVNAGALLVKIET